MSKVACAQIRLHAYIIKHLSNPGDTWLQYLFYYSRNNIFAAFVGYMGAFRKLSNVFYKKPIQFCALSTINVNFWKLSNSFFFRITPSMGSLRKLSNVVLRNSFYVFSHRKNLENDSKFNVYRQSSNVYRQSSNV